MRRRVRAKWRPPLTFVLAGPLAAVFALPMLGVGYFQLAGGVLGRNETTFLIGWIALVAALVLGYLLWRLVLRPVRRLKDYADAVTQGKEGQMPKQFGTPEFSQLGQSVADMSRVLQAREAVVMSYADHVTHEIRTPMTAILGAAELLADPQLPQAERDKLLALIARSTSRMSDLIDAQRAFARAADPASKGCSALRDLVPEGAVLARDGQVDLPAEVLRVVLDHLVNNALAHGAKTVTVSATDDGFTVTDDGAGISPGNRSRIFDPFFTTRRDDGGTGMGLAIVRRMLEAQGAEIALDDTAVGTCFRVRC